MATVLQRANEILLEKTKDIRPENIKAGVQIFDIMGTLEAGLDTSKGTATKEDILDGKIAYVKGKEVIGQIPIIKSQQDKVDTNPIISTDMTIGGEKGFIFKSPMATKTAFEQDSAVSVKVGEKRIADQIHLRPEQILKGETVLGVEGAVISGEGMTGGNALAKDIVLGKSAFVNGVEIQGSVPEKKAKERTVDFSDVESIGNTSNSLIFQGKKITRDELLRENSEYEIKASEEKIASYVGLTPDKILEGNTILGIVGKATGERDDIKTFATTEELLASPAKENDIGIVYDSLLNKIKEVYQYKGKWTKETLAKLVEKTQPITTNGRTEIVPEEGEDGFSKIIIETNVAGSGNTDDATAYEYDIVLGKTAYARNGKLIGALPEEKSILAIKPEKVAIEDNKSDTLTISATNSKDVVLRAQAKVSSPITYSKMASTIGLEASKIAKGTTILGVQGTLESSTGIDTNDATAVETDIAATKTAYVKGKKITGNLFEGKGTINPLEVFKNDGNIKHEPDRKKFVNTLTVKKDFIGRTNATIAVEIEETKIAETLQLLPSDIPAGREIFGVKGTGVVRFNANDEMQGQATILPENTISILFENQVYSGTYQLIQGKWEMLGGASDNVNIMAILNEVDGVNDPYIGAGGSDEQVGAALDKLANPIQQ